MREARVIVDVATLRIRAAGPATGTFWVEVGGASLPMVGWNDFVVVVLGWWTEALVRLVEGRSLREELRFMDGPYSLLLRSCPEQLVYVTFLSRANGHAETNFGEVPIGRLAESLLKAAEEVLAALRALGTWSSDEGALEAATLSLRAAMKSLPISPMS